MDLFIGYTITADVLDIGKFTVAPNRNHLTIWIVINHHSDGVVPAFSFAVYNVKLNNIRYNYWGQVRAKKK